MRRLYLDHQSNYFMVQKTANTFVQVYTREIGLPLSVVEGDGIDLDQRIQKAQKRKPHLAIANAFAISDSVLSVETDQRLNIWAVQFYKILQTGDITKMNRGLDPEYLKRGILREAKK